MFQNDTGTAAKILPPHQLRPPERMADYPVVLAVQATTYLHYPAHPLTTGLGPIGTEEQDSSGLLLHTTLVLTPEGLPLGLLAQEIWARDAAAAPLTPKERPQRPLEEQESYKGLQALRPTVALTPAGVQPVTVCAREGAGYEFLGQARELLYSFAP